jgi:predicted neutral ceramidase superfamily lipid hydrolase
MYIFITLTYAISSLHLLLALINIIVGIISQSRSTVWMAYSISPIWSGVFVSLIDDKIYFKRKFYYFKFGFCGGIGIISARQKGLYVVK